MIEARGEVDKEAEDLVKTLHLALTHASTCESEATKEEAVHLVGKSVEVLDKWIHERSGSKYICFVKLSTVPKLTQIS